VPYAFVGVWEWPRLFWQCGSGSLIPRLALGSKLPRPADARFAKQRGRPVA
jgi:hypothetical protein